MRIDGQSACTWLAAALLTVNLGCVRTQPELPPVRDAGFAPEPDERPLWEGANAFDREIEKAQLCFEDAALQLYLDGVVRRLLAEMGAPTAVVRVRVLRDPFLNALALPNGTIYLHSGILVRIDNEAQLATVLGHELSHFLRRHSLLEVRAAAHTRRHGRAEMIAFADAVARAGGDATLARILADIPSATQAQLLATQVHGHAAVLELEADADGFDAIRRAAYDPREAPKVFTKMQEEQQESGLSEPFFFGSHPRLSERIAFFSARLTNWSAPAGAVFLHADTAAFDEAIADLLLENAALDLRVRRVGHARRAVDSHLARRPASAKGYYQLGEVQRAGGAAQEALASYTRATQLDPQLADPYREIGMLRRAQGNDRAARAALERYLELAPTDAPDHAIVQGYVVDLGSVHAAP